MAGEERVGSNIQITGVKATIAALKVFEPEIQKALNATIKEALRVVSAGAKARYPGGSWVVGVNNKKLLGYIAARAGGGGWKGQKLSTVAPGTRAAVLEFIGAKNSGSTPQVAGLIASMNRRYGQPGRFLWAAWDAQGQAALDEIKTAVNLAERDLQSKLDAAGEGY